MQALRQQAPRLTRLLQLAPPQALAAPWQHQAAAAISGSAARAAFGGGGGITGWLTDKIAGVAGAKLMENLTIDDFAENISKARKLGAMGSLAFGAGGAKDGSAQGAMRQWEMIVGAMTPEEKKDLGLFGPEARQRVATKVGCTTGQVDDCIARYLWTRELARKVAQMQKAGEPVPSSQEEIEQMVGSWRQYKTQHDGLDGRPQGQVPLGHTGSKGMPCPLAGVPVGKNTKCPATGKSFKACCGKSLKLQVA